MQNIINYYYNLYIIDIKFINGIYTFSYNEDNFYFVCCEGYDMKKVHEINLTLQNSPYNQEIIINKEKNIVTMVDEKPYILYRINDCFSRINLYDIEILESHYLNNITKPNWSMLWGNKNDYLEMQIREIGLEFPLLSKIFSFFIGLSENAISYYNMININSNNKLTTRRVFKGMTVVDMYNPLNIIIDHKSRGIAEYIKVNYKEKNLYSELDEYFKRNTYSKEDMELLYARILYPTEFFDLYDKIIQGITEDNAALELVNNIDKYLLFLKDMYYYLSSYIHINYVPWLLKN